MKTQFYTLALNISDSEMISLKQKHQSLSQFIESGNVIPCDYVENLREFLYSILQKQPSWQTIVEQNHYQHLVLKLIHNDNQILNLPWQLALEKKPNIFLQKGLSLSNNIHSPKNPLPLKILIMVSSPKDGYVIGRLSFEEEELSILRSFDK